MKEDLDRCNQVLCKNYLTKNGIRIAEVKYTLDELNLFYNALIAYYKTEGFCCISLDTVSNKISVEAELSRVFHLEFILIKDI